MFIVNLLPRNTLSPISSQTKKIEKKNISYINVEEHKSEL